MRRLSRIGAGILLALLIVTCTDKDVTGPRGRGVTALNLSAFQPVPTPGAPDIPLDSLRVVLRRIPGLASALDTVFSLAADTLAADSLKVSLGVILDENPESFQLSIQAYGGGAVWYQATDTVSISSGGTSTPRLLARYVGPGAGATGVTMGPRDTTVVGGQAVPLRVVVDSAGTPIGGVPVGFASSDTTKGKVTQPTYTTGSFLGKANIRDSVWLYVETPTHLRDSTRIHIVPPPSQLVKISGDSQTAIVNAPLPAQLAVRVEDALNGGSPGVAVTWSVTQGTATLAPGTPVVSDTGGYARVTVTPSSLGAVKVQAAAAGLTGSPITFTVNVLAGTVRQVIVAPKVDTIAKGATAQFTATLKDSLGNVISGIKPVWTSSNPAVATVDSTGLATALAGDSTSVVASAGGFADTARLFVRAPAKVAITPSDTVITAVGDSVHLAGVVLTNFGDTVKTGTVIRFASTVPGVVTVNAVTGEAQLVGAGNGVVQATDTVSKVTGTATLRVNQKVNGIVNIPPDSILVGIGGQAQIIATAVDRNSHAIPGKTFGWVSRNTTVATVDQTGIVTGHAVGAFTFVVDSLIDSLTVFKDSTRVVGTASPPPVMQWAFDTLAIGNGGNTTVTVSLNVPSAAGTVLQIVSGDTTKVKPTQTRIAIGTGGASASVTLQGLAATLTPVNVVAQDSAGIYKPDTLRVVVVSTIYFASVGQTTRNQDFYLNQNETLNGQVFLSDPAPTGGLGVTFVFGKGYASIAPTTVIIPQGQLAAPVQFQGLAVGTDSVTPSSGAFAGKFSYLHVAKDSLLSGVPYPGTGVIGLGQWEQPTVNITYGMDHILPFAVSVSPAVATAQSPDTIYANNGGQYFKVTGTTLGAGTVTVSANNWISTSFPVIVSTPKLGPLGSTSIVAGSPASSGYWQVYTEDTIGYSHPVSAPVHVTATSRDTTVIKVLIDTLTVALNNSSANVGSSMIAQPGAGGDSTYVVMSAPGYRSDSMLVHVTKPILTTGYGYPYTGTVGVNQLFTGAGYLQIPYARPDSFWVVFSHTRKGVISGPDSVVIPKGSTQGNFNIAGDTLFGVDSITITRATGYVVNAGPQWVYRVDSLHVHEYGTSGTYYTISPPSGFYIQADEENGTNRPLLAPLTVTIATTRPNVFTVDSATLTIPAGASTSAYDTLRVSGSVVPPDSTWIKVSAPGFPAVPDSGSYIRVLPTPLFINLSGSSYVGHGLRTQGNYVYLPAAAPNTLSVALGRTVPGKDTLVPLSVTIPKGQSSSSPFQIWGIDSTASDTITASAGGYATGKATIFLTRDTLRMSKPSASQITTAPPYRLYTYLYNVVGYNENAWAPVTMTFTSSNPTVVSIDSGQVVNATQDTVTAKADSGQSYGVVRINFVGPGTAYVKATAPGFGADSFAVTVTGPSLTFSSPSATVGVNQFISEQVYAANPVTGSPLSVTLQRSDSTAAVGSQAFQFSPVTLTIPVGQTVSNVDTLTGSNIAAAQLIARAAGYGAATATIQVGKPQLVAPSTVNLWVGAVPYQTGVNTQDQAGSYRAVAVATPVTVTITDPTVASVDSAVRTVPIGANGTLTGFRFTPLKKGAVQAVFSATGYKSDTMTIVVDTGTLVVSGPTVLGAGQTSAMSVNIPYQTQTPVVVTLQSSNPSVLRVPATVTILAGQSGVGFTDTALAVGAATITASAPGALHASTPVGVTVSTPHLVVSIGTSANAGQGDFFTVYAEDSVNGSHPVVAPLTIHLSASPSGHSIFSADSLILPAGSQSIGGSVSFDTATSFTVTASATGYASGTSSVITVSGVEVQVGVGNATTFTPGTDTVAVNHYVTWVWDSTNTVNHQIHWLSGPGSPPGDSPLQSSGTYQVYFSQPGTYTYWCTVHTSAMQGTIVVQ